jgi:hypothetical protein
MPGIECEVVAHERRHVAIHKEEWNKFVDDVNPNKGWWCVPCGQKLRDLSEARYDLYLAEVDDRNLRFDREEYDSETNDEE